MVYRKLNKKESEYERNVSRASLKGTRTIVFVIMLIVLLFIIMTVTGLDKDADMYDIVPCIMATVLFAAVEAGLFAFLKKRTETLHAKENPDYYVALDATIVGKEKITVTRRRELDVEYELTLMPDETPDETLKIKVAYSLGEKARIGDKLSVVKPVTSDFASDYDIFN